MSGPVSGPAPLPKAAPGAVVPRRICAGSDLVERGLAVRFAIRWLGHEATGFVVRFGGAVHAYVNQCSHVAMELDWQPGDVFDRQLPVLVCATHGALFEPDTGRCAGGPCMGRGGLRALVVEERDGAVWWTPDVSATAVDANDAAR